MGRIEELTARIAEAEAELAELSQEHEAVTYDECMRAAPDYVAWKGRSAVLVDILNAEVLPANLANRQSRMYDYELSYCSMEKSEEIGLMIVQYWENEPVIERGVVTHFRKINVTEKRYQRADDTWELING